MKDLKELFRLLEERLVQHDNDRIEVQRKLQEVCANVKKCSDKLEEKLSWEIRTSFDKIEKDISSLIERLTEGGGGGGGESKLESLIKQARDELMTEKKFVIKPNRYASGFADSYVFDVTTVGVGKKIKVCKASDTQSKIEFLTSQLRDHLDKIHQSMTSALETLNKICNNKRKEGEELGVCINERLESPFNQEDSRIQELLNTIRVNIGNTDPAKAKELSIKAIRTLVENQKYEFTKQSRAYSLVDYTITPVFKPSLKFIEFEERKPENFTLSFTKEGMVLLSFTFFDDDEVEFLSPFNLSLSAVVEMWEKGNKEGTSKTLAKRLPLGSDEPICFSGIFSASTTYSLRMKIAHQDLSTQWSDDAEFTTPEFKECCVWKECSVDNNGDENGDYDDDDELMMYEVDAYNPRIARKVEPDYYVIIGNTYIPPNQVTSWSIKILDTVGTDGSGIYIGVAPSDINEDYTYLDDQAMNDNYGWLLSCYDLTLCSGPPHKYNNKDYGPRKEDGEYVHTGDSVGVIMDTTNGDLSFVLNGVNLGVAYEGIPLDKPLVPCVPIEDEGDAVELDTTEVKENVSEFIPFPSSITVESNSWDSITLAWGVVEEAAFYQIEVDGRKAWDSIIGNEFTKRGFFPETEHTFRVRAVKGNSVSGWSDVVKGKTIEVPEFDKCAWKSCPKDVYMKNSYTVEWKNPLIAKKQSFSKHYSTVIGNSPLPLNKATSWSVKILKSRDNNGFGICIGVAPFDINQNEKDEFDTINRTGWFFYCYDSSLYTTPPLDYGTQCKSYGLRRANGQYVHNGDSVGVMMDTTNGDLSFAVNGVNLGVAFEGIPLDKPLVPCVLLNSSGDSVELDLSEVKENVSKDVSVPSNVTTKSITWDSITLTWDAAGRASFYQIEVDGSKAWNASTTNVFTKRGLLEETEHTFRVRAVRGNYVSEWSGVAKGRTQKESFETSGWKDLPASADYIEDFSKYSVEESNPRAATMVTGTDYFYTTVLGNTAIPLDKVTSWSIKILRSREDAFCIFIGVAPSDIDVKNYNNWKCCGWYIGCYRFILCSGPPHNYKDIAYGPRKNPGEYVHPGGSVGVVMDTTKGELSYLLDGVNHGPAYEGIPLDKPLVPCVLLGHKGNSVELVI